MKEKTSFKDLHLTLLFSYRSLEIYFKLLIHWKQLTNLSRPRSDLQSLVEALETFWSAVLPWQETGGVC